MRSHLFVLVAVALLLSACTATAPSRPPADVPVGGTTAAAVATPPPHVHPPFEDGRIAFAVRAGDIESSLGTLSAFVLPGTTLAVAAVGGSGTFEAKASGGQLFDAGKAMWTWKAPQRHGDHVIRIHDLRGADGDTAILHVFVLHPYDGGDRIGSYRIGHYAAQRHNDGDGDAYRRPEGFVEVTAANVDTQVSPHFRLGQFVCKEGDDYPKYIALRTALLVKLEALLEALAEHGVPANSLHVMSGYRTPAYNAGIGNETIYSRHTYGDAADVFLDRDGDGMEDDLDGDGRSTREDARILYQLVEGTLDQALPGALAGGLSAYGPTDAHGPFLHIDTRGKRARW